MRQSQNIVSSKEGSADHDTISYFRIREEISFCLCIFCILNEFIAIFFSEPSLGCQFPYLLGHSGFFFPQMKPTVCISITLSPPALLHGQGDWYKHTDVHITNDVISKKSFLSSRSCVSCQETGKLIYWLRVG